MRKNAKVVVNLRGKTIKRLDDEQGMLFNLNLNLKFKREKNRNILGIKVSIREFGHIINAILIPGSGILYMGSVKTGAH